MEERRNRWVANTLILMSCLILSANACRESEKRGVENDISALRVTWAQLQNKRMVIETGRVEFLEYKEMYHPDAIDCGEKDYWSFICKGKPVIKVLAASLGDSLLSQCYSQCKGDYLTTSEFSYLALGKILQMQNINYCISGYSWDWLDTCSAYSRLLTLKEGVPGYEEKLKNMLLSDYDKIQLKYKKMEPGCHLKDSMSFFDRPYEKPCR